MLRVVVIDDSPVARDLLTEILNSDADIEVVGTAIDGLEGVELADSLNPDVITMDVQMPRMDGYTATQQIMQRHPTPIVVISGTMSALDIEKSMKSLQAGALAVIGKPVSPTSPLFDKAARTVIDTVKLMSEVKVVRQRQFLTPPPQAPEVEKPKPSKLSQKPEIVAIAASTGGPQALYQLLTALPGTFPLPILIVQHISPGFTEGFVKWLNDSVALPVQLAIAGDRIQQGTIYIAPEDAHLEVDIQSKIVLSDRLPIDGFRPAGTALFESVARTYGARAIAVILSGMGRDGTDGLKSIRHTGGCVFAQDEASCIVHGMPKVATDEGLANWVQNPEQISRSLMKMVKG